jgi:hypothetical protein
MIRLWSLATACGVLVAGNLLADEPLPPTGGKGVVTALNQLVRAFSEDDSGARDPDTGSPGDNGSRVKVGNLVYAGTKTSKCFSDKFLVTAEETSNISTTRRLHTVRLDSEEMFDFPLVIMTGEGEFQLTDAERHVLREYLERGGFLLASSGCSSVDWDRSFRREMGSLFPDRRLEPIDVSHPIFHTVADISELRAKHGTPRPLEGLSFGDRLGVLYSQDGLNDTPHTQGCCCCGGNEITNAIEVNVNILAYTLVY